ncbi:hypothetical protein B296_00013324 [Ensete ventricosum]|uniref:Uncharacterized protein n=1 Tax=Ensete ventricosum TaxID=4639 RepID=A0A427ARD7_ENSVE|nr:hypothetical protein B296_00013324 [Ensete ventricosum]
MNKYQPNSRDKHPKNRTLCTSGESLDHSGPPASEIPEDILRSPRIVIHRTPFHSHRADRPRTPKPRLNERTTQKEKSKKVTVLGFRVRVSGRQIEGDVGFPPLRALRVALTRSSLQRKKQPWGVDSTLPLDTEIDISTATVNSHHWVGPRISLDNISGGARRRPKVNSPAHVFCSDHKNTRRLRRKVLEEEEIRELQKLESSDGIRVHARIKFIQLQWGRNGNSKKNAVAADYLERYLFREIARDGGGIRRPERKMVGSWRYLWLFRRRCRGLARRSPKGSYLA